MKKIMMDVAECRPIAAWKPMHGDILTCSRLFSTWFGLITDVDDRNETVDIIYAASPRVLFGLTRTEQAKRKKRMDVTAIRDSKTFAIQQVFGGKSTWYLQ